MLLNMCRIKIILYSLIFISIVSQAQDKIPSVTFGIERGIERSKNDFSFFDDNGMLSNLISNNSHDYWRLYVGIPFRFPRFKIDAGLGFSSNEFFRSLVLSSPGSQAHKYSGIGIDYFFKIPLGIGEERFDMGAEFRHQILMSRRGGGPGNFSSQFGGDGTVKNSYISLGAYAQYMIVRQNQVDMGLNTNVGLSAFKYHNTFFLTNNNLSFYINFGIIFYMYKSPKEQKGQNIAQILLR